MKLSALALTVAMVVGGHAHADSLDCQLVNGTLPADMSSPALPSPLTCDEVPIPGQGLTDRLFIQRGNALPVEREQAIIAGMMAARGTLRLRGDRPYPPVMLLVTDVVDVRTDGAGYPLRGTSTIASDDHDVLVVLNRNSDELTPPQLSQLVVALLQYAIMPRMFDKPADWFDAIEDTPATDWWPDPLALALSATSFPAAGLETRPEASPPWTPTLPFYEQGSHIGALPFFAYALRQPNIDSAAFTRTLESIDPAHPDGQRRILAAWLAAREPTLLAGLAKALVDGRVPRAGPGYLPVVARGAQSFGFAQGVLSVDSGPLANLAFRRVKLRFEAAGKYSVNVLAPSGVTVFARAPGADTWEIWRGPQALESPCDRQSEAELLLVALLANGAEQSDAISIVSKGEPLTAACGCTAGINDRCLVGSWTYDNAAMKEVYTQLADVGLSWRATTGKLALVVSAGGAATFEATDWSHETRGLIELGGTLPPLVFDQKNVVNGRGDAHLGNGPPSQHHMCLEPGTNTFAVRSEVTMPDGTTAPTGQLAAPDLAGFLPALLKTGYTCTSRTLAFDLWVPVQGGRLLRVPYRFTKSR
ncbi:MAG: hypothetical protein U1F43_19380 [Myxococcota bacterium]